MLDVVSTPIDDAIGTPRMAPEDGRCGKLRACAFHGTVASPSLPEAHSTYMYYSLLLEQLFTSQGA